VAKTQEPLTGVPAEPTPDSDLLAAVVLDTLVSDASSRCTASGVSPGGLTLAEIARACERDPARPDEAREIEIALEILLADDLATRDADRYRPTRAAIRAAELSF
jgi:hypothetical protein